MLFSNGNMTTSILFMYEQYWYINKYYLPVFLGKASMISKINILQKNLGCVFVIFGYCLYVLCPWSDLDGGFLQ